MPIVLAPTTTVAPPPGTLAGSFGSLFFGPGSKIHVGGITGLDDLPGIRAFDQDRAGDHGAWLGVDLMATRTIELTLHLIGDTAAEYAGLVAQLEAVMQPQATEQNLYLYGSSRMVKVRPRRLSLPYEADRFSRTGTAVAQFLASDPRVYDAVLQSPSIGLPTAGTGFAFTFGFPLSFGVATSGGNLNLSNAGNFPTRPLLTVQGPCLNPSITNVTAGKQLAFGITLGSGDSLTIDTDARSVLLNGIASRRNTLTAASQWWELAPGTSTLQFRAGAYQAAALLTVAFRSAWLGRGGLI